MDLEILLSPQAQVLVLGSATWQAQYKGATGSEEFSH
jgi:hypothetical protein